MHIDSILSAAPALLSRTIASFQKAYPGVFLTVSEATLDVLQERLELRELDLIIAPLDLRLYKTHLGSELLIDDSLRIVTRKGHPLTLKKRPQWVEAAQCSWILPPPGTPMRQCIEQAFMNQGLAIPQAGIKTASIITIQTLLQETYYLTVDLVVHAFTHPAISHPLKSLTMPLCAPKWVQQANFEKIGLWPAFYLIFYV